MPLTNTVKTLFEMMKQEVKGTVARKVFLSVRNFHDLYHILSILVNLRIKITLFFTGELVQ